MKWELLFNKLQHLEFDYSGREYGVVARTNLIFDQQQDLSFSPFKKSFQRKGLGEDASAGLVSFSGSQKAGLQELSFNDFSFSFGQPSCCDWRKSKFGNLFFWVFGGTNI